MRLQEVDQSAVLVLMDVLKARNQNDNKIYAIKFACFTLDTHRQFFLDEITTTLFMRQYFESKFSNDTYTNIPTVKLFDYEKQFIHRDRKPNKWNIVMVMEYHEIGDVEHIDQNRVYSHYFLKYRDAFVLKFLLDMGSVLQTMWKHGIIDRDFKLRNVVISGTGTHPFNTTFVKIDYGTSISTALAIIELQWQSQYKCMSRILSLAYAVIYSFASISCWFNINKFVLFMYF